MYCVSLPVWCYCTQATLWFFWVKCYLARFVLIPICRCFVYTLHDQMQLCLWFFRNALTLLFVIVIKSLLVAFHKILSKQLLKTKLKNTRLQLTFSRPFIMLDFFIIIYPETAIVIPVLWIDPAKDLFQLLAVVVTYMLFQFPISIGWIKESCEKQIPFKQWKQQLFIGQFENCFLDKSSKNNCLNLSFSQQSSNKISASFQN